MKYLLLALILSTTIVYAAPSIVTKPGIPPVLQNPEGELPYRAVASGKFTADDTNQIWVIEFDIYDAEWRYIESGSVYLGYTETPNVLFNRVEQLKWDVYYSKIGKSSKQAIVDIIAYYQSERSQLACYN